jgi:oxygen-independent coproporphyrinogen III oxidase
MYERMLGRAAEAGYEHYEISNLCRPGFESRHNTKYWTGEPYFGFGCSAHSYDGAARRWSNERDALKYVELVEHGVSPISEKQILTESDVRAASLFLGLRLMRGVSLDLCKDYQPDRERFREAGLLELDGDCVRLTRNGALLSNEVFSAFV